MSVSLCKWPLRFVLAAFAVAGCAQLLGFEELTDKVAPVDGSPALPGVVADFYVSPTGDDTADGSSERPLRSVRTAVDRATSALLSGTPQRIAVCAGDYPEPSIDVRGAITISGSYDCQRWTRAELDDAPSGPSGEPLSRLTDLPSDADEFLKLFGDESGKPALDGLDIAASHAVGTVSVEGSASVRHCTISNSALPRSSAQFFTTALAVSGRDSTIEHCDITLRQPDGAAGKGGVGIGIAGGPHVVRRNAVNVLNVIGRGIGVIAGMSGELDLAENHVSVGNGLHNEDSTASIGVDIVDANTRSTRNVVHIETPGHVSSPTQVFGFASRATSRLVSDGDRIVGPTVLRAEAKEKVLQFAGFYDEGGLERVVNASILLNVNPMISLQLTAGIRLQGKSNAYIAHNTMYLAGKEITTDAGVAPVGYGLNVAADPPNAVTFDANLVLLGNATMGLVRSQCNASQFTSLAHNRYAGTDVPGRGPACDGGAPLDAFWPGADRPENDNRIVSCGGSCADLVDTGVTSVIEAGMKLTPAGCAAGLVLAGADAGVTVDGTGAPRDTTRTYAGAFANCP